MILARIRKGVEIQHVEDEILVFVLKDNSFYRFNESAADILKLLIKEKDRDKTAVRYAKLYSISLGQAEIDVDILIKDCIKKKILV